MAKSLTDHSKHKNISSNPDLTMTSVKVHEGLFDRFKIESVRNKLTFQKLVNRCMNLYINEIEFRNKINLHLDLQTSGSL